MTIPRPKLKAPFPYFGGKSRVAHLVWRAFGNVPNYVEPFFGSGAVLLGRPHEPKIETVNDLDCYLANFWRAIQQAPEEVAKHADWPVNEADLHARHDWLVGRQPEMRSWMQAEPEYFDPKVAGWWVWGASASITGNWLADYGRNSRPDMRGSRVGYGIHQILPRMPSLGTSGRGSHSPESGPLVDWFDKLSERLRRVRVACGDWSRVLSGSVTGISNTQNNMGMQPCGVFLDPPYDTEERAGGCYLEDDGDVSADVARWARENGDNPNLRIALCGYEGEHEMPPEWACVPWKAQGGYGNRNGGENNENARRERIWFSPHCLPLEEVQPSLFKEGA